MSLWRGMGQAQVVHVFANSGWAWHLLAAPALAIARLRGVPAIVNYRGGQADEFFAAAPRHVLRALTGAVLRVTPSPFLVRVFARHGLTAEVVPNIIDLSRFRPRALGDFGDAPCLVVARNLEPIYDIPTALRAFVAVREHYPRARLTVAGSGPERERLQALALQLGLGDAVRFTGRVEHADMPALYAQADCALNPSTVDNMPNSVLEAFASGVPVVSTDVGGVPDIVTHGVSGLLVPAGDAPGMAREVLHLLGDRQLAGRLASAGVVQVQAYGWPQVRQQWLAAYRRVARDRGGR
jgi:glycosyltransferase involved in cell wall biosynthesis